MERQGAFQEAADAFLQAIHLLADDSRPLISLGGLRLRRGQYCDAIKLVLAGLALKPFYAEADARLVLAEAYELAGQIEHAIAQWRIVAQMEPSYPSDGKPMEEARRRLAKHISGA